MGFAREMSIPLISFNTPTEPFYQFLNIGEHIGNVKINFPRRYCLEVGQVDLLHKPHQIWLSRKNSFPAQILNSADFIDEETGIDNQLLDEMMRIPQEWLLKCIDERDETCFCARDGNSLEYGCKCLEKIILFQTLPNFCSAMTTLSQIITETMGVNVIAQNIGDYVTPRVNFVQNGTDCFALKISSENFCFFGQMKDYSVSVVNSCQKFRNWASLLCMVEPVL